ncbi:MAG: OmpH family outer membrane protein [Clostridiaceae bacterium]|jgi:outer membrane protein|nr:OmpH family outer membrane protein [Clostridiaceae bacterium]
MNNKMKLMVGFTAVVLGFTGANFANAATDSVADIAPASYNVAVVDVQRVVASSAQVAALKKDQEAKAKDLIAFVEKARKDVTATTDEKKKAALEDKYNKELNTKKAAIDKTYAEKLQAIDTSISSQIGTIAKNNGYNVVLAKGVVLFGGTDITDTVIKAVK